MTTAYLETIPVDLIANTLLRHVDLSVAEYVNSVIGKRSFSLAQLAVRIWTVNQVIDELSEVRPTLPEQIQHFDIESEMRKAFEQLRTLATDSSQKPFRVQTRVHE